MNTRILTGAILGLWGAALAADAGVTVSNDAWRNNDVFGIVAGPGQAFHGRVGSINSMSLQEYQTSTFVVTEFVLDMAGSPLQLRIWFAETVDINETLAPVRERVPLPQAPRGLQKLADKAKLEADKEIARSKLIKDYPLTTHAKTIEYKIEDRASVVELYEKMLDRWLNPRGAVDGSPPPSAVAAAGSDPAAQQALRERREKRTLHSTLFTIVY